MCKIIQVIVGGTEPQTQVSKESKIFNIAWSEICYKTEWSKKTLEVNMVRGLGIWIFQMKEVRGCRMMASFSWEVVKQVKTGEKTERNRDEDETREQVLCRVETIFKMYNVLNKDFFKQNTVDL